MMMHDEHKMAMMKARMAIKTAMEALDGMNMEDKKEDSSEAVAPSKKRKSLNSKFKEAVKNKLGSEKI